MLQKAQSSLDTAKENPMKRAEYLFSQKSEKQAVPLILQSKRNGTFLFQFYT
jgi:hypothetical protein